MQLQKTQNQFNHELFGELTTITSNENEIFFVMKEVSDILGYKDSQELNRRLEEDEFIKLSHAEAKPILNRDDIHSSGIQLLTESGLYSAVLGSKKPEAKQFKRWVTSEVLPAIRKSGSYSVAPMSQLEILSEAISLLRTQDARVSKVEEDIQVIHTRLAEPSVVALLGVPNPSPRQKIEAIVAGYTKVTKGDYKENWNLLYSKLYLHYRIRVKSYKKDKNQSWLDVVEQKGHCDELLALATKYFSI